MALPQPLVETIIPLTNSRGFGKLVRFDYKVGSERPLPLVVSPQIHAMAGPFFTRQALYFLSDLDCAIRTYSEEGRVGDGTCAGDRRELGRAAEDCLFEYSLRNPASRLTTRSELPLRRTKWESTIVRVKKPGYLDETYMAVDGEPVLLPMDSRQSFEDLYDAFLADLHDPDVGRQAIGDGAEAFLPGLISGDGAGTPVVFKELPYTFEEVELLSRIVPMDPEMIGKFSSSDLLKAERDECQLEAIVALLNQPYAGRVERLPAAKFPDQENIEVVHTYEPRLLDFYFAGLRSLSPVVEFKSYYNVVEYYFEDASLDCIKAELDEVFSRLKEAEDIESFNDSAKRLKVGEEREQIRRVVQGYVSLERLRSFFDQEIPASSRTHFESFNGVISGKEVQKIRIGNDGLQLLVADRIYSFRNAIFHSKRTLKGKGSIIIRPCSEEETEIVSHEALLIKMVAQEIIKQSRRSG